MSLSFRTREREEEEEGRFSGREGEGREGTQRIYRAAAVWGGTGKIFFWQNFESRGGEGCERGYGAAV